MTETEWLHSTDVYEMLEFLLGTRKASDRKLRLFAVACSRRIWNSLHDIEQRALSVVEQCLDGVAGEPKRAATYERFRRAAEGEYGSGDPRVALELLDRDARFVAQAVMLLMPESPHLAASERTVWSSLLGCIIGNPFHPPPTLSPYTLAWNGGCIPKLATNIYEERDFSQERMGVLSDALEEAGVEDTSLLEHLRGPKPHSRGCHVLDILLGKE